MEEIVYRYENGIYVNLTNHCPCRCSFCIRGQMQGLGTAESLWLDHTPALEEVIKALESFPMEAGQEVVFCGYGEPLCALDVLAETAKYLKEKGMRLRINTNGLGDRINGKPTIPVLKGLIDTVSISLNAPNAARYDELCRPAMPGAYESMLEYARECKKYFDTRFSVVDVIPPEEIAQCQKIADEMGIPLRVRHFTDETLG